LFSNPEVISTAGKDLAISFAVGPRGLLVLLGNSLGKAMPASTASFLASQADFRGVLIVLGALDGEPDLLSG
jgi:hypothetical protein